MVRLNSDDLYGHLNRESFHDGIELSCCSGSKSALLSDKFETETPNFVPAETPRRSSVGS